MDGFFKAGVFTLLATIIICGRSSSRPTLANRTASSNCFFRSLKEEVYLAASLRQLREARAAITYWIEWSNAERPHQPPGYRSPQQFRVLKSQLMV